MHAASRGHSIGRYKTVLGIRSGDSTTVNGGNDEQTLHQYVIRRIDAARPLIGYFRRKLRRVAPRRGALSASEAMDVL
jgi:hypothetical protein